MATLHIRDVPDELQEAARIEAIKSKTSLREIVIEALRRELKRREAERDAS